MIKALILNSGMGKRMGKYTKNLPKCMISITPKDTILSHQLKLLQNAGIHEVIMTTGLYHEQQKEYIKKLGLSMDICLIENKKYAETNYIYSMFLAGDYLEEDTLILHGDLVFTSDVLKRILDCQTSTMAVSSTKDLPKKDFKAVIHHDKITAVGIEFFHKAMAAQPLYLLKKRDWQIWKDKIIEYCARGEYHCYAENALNEILDIVSLSPTDVKMMLCQEIDCEEDLLEVKNKLTIEDRD